MPNRRRYSFWMTEAQAAGLKQVKQTKGISESEQIRQALDGWLKARGVLRSIQSNPLRGRPQPKKQVTPSSRGGSTMRLSEYLKKKNRPITSAQSQKIRARVMAGGTSEEVAVEVGCVPIQVAAVKANMKRGR